MNTITHEIINYQSNIPIKLFFQRIGLWDATGITV